MKKLICVFLACIMLLCACTPTEENSSPKQESEASSVEDASSVKEESVPDEVPETSMPEASIPDEGSEEPIVKNYPTVSGTFVQLWAFADYSVSQWENHFNKLLEVGIDTVIVQWTATTPYGEFKDCYYSTALADGNSTSDYVCYSACMDRMFQAAKTTGTNIYLGLNLSDEWWNYTALTTEWAVSQADVGVKIAKELYQKYYADYSESFAGWYWAWELYNHMGEFAAPAAQFINLYIDGLNAIDPTLPLMLSPFISDGVSETATESVWDTFFAIANFRAGDIFCCQDSVGAGHLPIEKLDSYCKAIYNSVCKEEGLIFWANNECFNSDFTSADLARFVEQMEITSKYVTGHVTFAYSHYYHPDKYPNLHQKYKDYYETGAIS